MNRESQCGKFNPEKAFAGSAEKALEANKLNAEKVAAKEQEKEDLLQAIMEAKEEAKNSGNYEKATELVARLVAMAKIEIKRQTATVEQAK